MIVPPGIVGWIGSEAKLGTTLVTRASGCEPGEQANRHDRAWLSHRSDVETPSVDRQQAGRRRAGRPRSAPLHPHGLLPSTQQAAVRALPNVLPRAVMISGLSAPSKWRCTDRSTE